MNLIYFLCRQSWKLALLAGMLSVMSGLSGAAIVAAISKAITVTGPQTALGFQFFALCLFYFLSKSGSELTLLHLTQNATFRLRQSISTRLLATSLKKQQSLGKHNLLIILTRDIETFVQSFQLLPLAFGNAIVIASCFAYLAWLSIDVFLIFTMFFVFGISAFRMAERRPQRQLLQVREKMESLYKHFRDLTEGTKELQLNAQRGTLFINHVIGPVALDVKNSFIRSMGRYICVLNIGTVIFYVILGILLFLLPAWLNFSTSILTTVALVLLYLIRPISELTFAIPGIRQSSQALEKIEQLNGELNDFSSAQISNNPFNRNKPLLLELNGICHHYVKEGEDHQFSLGPLDLSIGQSEILFIVGGNGCGKTTLAMLLLGLYEPDVGSITLNGIAVSKGNLHHYRQHFSAVFADYHLFDQLLDIDEDSLSARAAQYIKRLDMAHKVIIKDGRFSTTELSTGQRKRLALVSAYLEDRPVYLFDEWAADQDPEFKRIFYFELLPDLKARGKTVIVITHDDAYFDCADRIIKLQDGEVQEIREATEAKALAG